MFLRRAGRFEVPIEIPLSPRRSEPVEVIIDKTYGRNSVWDQMNDVQTQDHPANHRGDVFLSDDVVKEAQAHVVDELDGAGMGAAGVDGSLARMMKVEVVEERVPVQLEEALEEDMPRPGDTQSIYQKIHEMEPEPRVRVLPSHQILSNLAPLDEVVNPLKEYRGRAKRVARGTVSPRRGPRNPNARRSPVHLRAKGSLGTSPCVDRERHHDITFPGTEVHRTSAEIVRII